MRIAYMHYRRFGKTNLQISVFSLGTMRGLANERDFATTVETAIALGINHLETARGYGESERYLGRTLQRLGSPRSQFHVTTKLSPTPDANLMRQQLQESLERLQLDRIDCLALHGINTWEHLDWVTSPDGCLPALQEALVKGTIAHLGFSTHAPLEVILAAIATGLFEFVNLHYYYFRQRNAPAIAAASKQDMGIFIISPADKGGRLYAPPEKLTQLCRPFTPLALTYRFLLSDRRISTLSLGAATPDELAPALAVADRTGPLSDREREACERLEAQFESALDGDRCRQCYQCLPCPETINIPEILRLRNLAIACDMQEYGQYRYRMFENAGHWFWGRKGDRCTDCGDCLPRCPESLDIPSLLRDAHRRLNGSPRRRLWED